jgi:hypothetical protein
MGTLRKSGAGGCEAKEGVTMYEHHETITKELLDGIKVGDLVKVNDWKRPLRVRGVTKNYFVMSMAAFGRYIYSVCEKIPWAGIRYNSMCGGMFHVGTDNYSWGNPFWDSVDCEAWDFSDKAIAEGYLKTFEIPETQEGHSELSVRTSVPICEIYIKRASA